ncbi:hypothetical protein Patl1_15724 [Pistacia atlantica]|uniref:Uncharacterized protein n=1 Tax=Pistacia atlantica TaxID=434234 RepID=A0ACC1B5T3_9ROSI|nr:hypothetical protein Patl1_15724 [Pistacia atlantica]
MSSCFLHLLNIPSFFNQIYSRVISNRNYVAKDINFGVGARAAMLQGVSEVVEAAKLQWDLRVAM